jgi:diguanylate cyclase (GGDEF)-like protein
MFKQRKRLITFITILLITGFLLTSLASYFISIASLRNQITYSELPLTSDNIYSEIQRDLLQPLFISSLMASDTFLRDWVINEEQNHEAIIRFLREIQTNYNTITAFFVSEKTHNYYHPDGLTKQINPEEKRDDWYFRVRDMKEDYEINVDIDMENNDALTFFINYRVYDYQKKFIGVTGVGLTVDSVQKLINHYQDKYKRDILFIDNKGNIKLNNYTSAVAEDSPHASDLYTFLQKRDLIATITSNNTLSLQHKYNGQQILLNSRFIKEFDWYLVVLQTELPGAGKLVKTLFLNLAVCAVISTVVLVLTNRTISFYQNDIEHMATKDKLTGLFNRQALDMLFKQVLLDQNRHPTDLSLLLLDLDHFKQINDTHGHLAGDAVLQHVAKLIKQRLRKVDIISRWGGEEFLIILKGCDIVTARNKAEELRLGIMNNPLILDKKTIGCTISIGVAVFESDDSSDKLINRADKAMYKAKDQGRNQVC